MQTAIITGSTGNLGSAMVMKFLDGGFRVIGTVNPRHEHEQAVLPDLERIGVDLGNEGKTADFAAGIIGKYGVPSVLILTAGGFVAGDIEHTDSNAIASQYRLNFETAYHLARPVFAAMLEEGRGSIYLTAARTGMDMKFARGLTAYGLSKSLVFRLGELLNLEGRKRNVRTAVIVPSTIDTPQNRSAMPGADFSKWVSPESIADKVYDHFLNKGEEELLYF